MKNVATISNKISIFFVCFLLLFTSLQAQSTYTVQEKQQAKEKLLQRVKTYSKKDFKKFHSRLPKENPLQEVLSSYHKNLIVLQNTNEVAEIEQLPTSIRTPAETEEIQAVFIAWPMFAYDINGNQVSPISNNIGFRYLSDEEYAAVIQILRQFPFKEDSISASLHVEIVAYTPDVDGNSPYAPVWAQLAVAIQEEVPVWIRIHSGQDSVDIKNYCLQRNTPLTNYRFFMIPQGGNDFWARDFSPIGFYHGDQDSLAFVDFTYYPGRAIDDSLGNYLLPQLGYKLYQTSLMNEGGNFFTDGNNRIFTSSAIVESNAQNDGQIIALTPNTNPTYRFRNSMTSAQVRDTLRYLFGADSITIFQRLQHDGGTGHLDLYLRQLDEERFMTTDFPEVYNNPQFPDYKKIRSHVGTIRQMNGPYNRPFELPTMPLPTNDDGSFSTRGNQYTQDARNYINGLLVNNTLIFPTYSDMLSGNTVADAEAIEYYKRALPGCKIIPIDSRILSPSGGALHCVTMQIPAENPLRIEFAPARGTFPVTMQNYDITTRITNRSGIKDATFVWRKKGTLQWNDMKLSENSSSNFTSKLSLQQFVEGDEIEYYIHSESNNGKSMNKPMSAPKGYYTVKIGNITSVSENKSFDPIGKIAVYPNPIYSNATFEITTLQPITTIIEIVDQLGTIVGTVFKGEIGKGTNFLPIKTESLSSGMYYIRSISNDKKSIIPISVIR